MYFPLRIRRCWDVKSTSFDVDLTLQQRRVPSGLSVKFRQRQIVMPDKISVTTKTQHYVILWEQQNNYIMLNNHLFFHSSNFSPIHSVAIMICVWYCITVFYGSIYAIVSRVQQIKHFLLSIDLIYIVNCNFQIWT